MEYTGEFFELCLIGGFGGHRGTGSSLTTGTARAS